jgi:hypothetical protein
MNDLAEEYGLEFLDPEAGKLLEGEDLDSLEDAIVYDDDTVGALVRPTSADARSQLSNDLEDAGYEPGEPLGTESYSVKVPPEGVEYLANHSEVEALELDRPM